MKKSLAKLTKLIVVLILVFVVLVAVTTNPSKQSKEAISNQIKSFNFALGTQTVGSKYKFTDETMLVETAKQIKAMGSNLLKFSMHPRYCTENYNLPKNDNITS